MSRATCSSFRTWMSSLYQYGCGMFHLPPKWLSPRMTSRAIWRRIALAASLLVLLGTSCRQPTTGRVAPPVPSSRSAARTGVEQSAAELNNDGVMLLEHDRGDFAGALELFQRAVKTDNSYVIGYINLGIAWFAQYLPNSEAAKVALDRAEKLG